MLRKYIYVVLMLLAVLNARAQEKDTASVAAVSDTATAVTLGRSILGLKMQKRYTPVNNPFLKEKGLFPNSFITVVGSGYRQFYKYYSNGPYLTFGFGKWFNSYHGMRLAGGAGYFFDNFEFRRVKMMDTRVSYLFNLSGYIDGYDPYRLIEFHPMAGLGYTMLWIGRDRPSFGPSIHIGTQVSLRVLPRVDLLFEPLFEIQKESRNLARGTDAPEVGMEDKNIWKGYLPAFHGGVGALIFLDRRNVGEDPGQEWFFSASAGVQWQHSDLVYKLGLKDALGGGLFLGAGRYITDILSVRGEGGFSRHNWNRDSKSGTLESSSYITARLDAIVDLLPVFFPDITVDFPLSAAVMAGPEVGLLIKEDYYKGDDTNIKTFKYPYVGATAGLHIKCGLFGGLSLFVEPRVSYVPYSSYISNEIDNSTKNQNNYDGVLSFSMGIEYKLVKKKEN